MSLTPVHINLDQNYNKLLLDICIEINVHVIHISTQFSRIAYS